MARKERCLLLALLASFILLPGCSDPLPTQKNSSGGKTERIMFTGFIESSDSGFVYTVEPDGSGLKRIPGTSWTVLASAPHSDLLPLWRAGGIFTAELEGTNQRMLVPYARRGDTASTFYPVLSPDGRKLAFATHDRGLWVMNVDGTAPLHVSEGGPDDIIPAFSPDGSQVAFAGREGTLYVIPSDGGVPVRIADNLVPPPGPMKNMISLDQWGISWSAKNRIAYVGRSGSGGTDIFAVDPDGSNQVNITGDIIGNTSPVWAPDGSRLAYVGGEEIWVIGADGSGRRNISNTLDVPDRHPQWSPDGTRLLYTHATLSGYGGPVRIAELNTGRIVTPVALPLALKAFWVK